MSVVIAGFGWLSPSGSGVVRIVDNPTTFELGTSDCAFVEDAPSDTVDAGIGGEEGEEPCDEPVSADPSTWGEVKGMFR